MSDIQLKVSMARRQFHMNLETSQSDSPTKHNWAKIAESSSEKGIHKDSREMPVYDGDDMFE